MYLEKITNPNHYRIIFLNVNPETAIFLRHEFPQVIIFVINFEKCFLMIKNIDLRLLIIFCHTATGPV